MTERYISVFLNSDGNTHEYLELEVDKTHDFDECHLSKDTSMTKATTI